MTKTLYLVRHAEAEKPGNCKDFERSLTGEGAAKFQHKMRALVNKSVEIDKMWVSAAKRARDTATIIQSAITVKIVNVEQYLYECSTKELTGIIESEEDTIEHVMIVGHNPTIRNVANFYLEHDIYTVEPGCIIASSFDVSEWQLASQKSAALNYLI